MTFVTMSDGTLVYSLNKLDLINMFAAHMERGTGKPLAGGNYEAHVHLGDDRYAVFEIVPTRTDKAQQQGD